ncbi:MAG: phage tail protein [Parafilimonas sp.]
MQLELYRSGEVVYTVNIGDDTVFKHEIMGAHTITSEFYYPSILEIFIGDYITFKGENFYVNVTPQIQKINKNTYKYNITFEGIIYRLYDKLLMDEGVSDFNYYGTPEDMLQLICDNMNTIDTGWSVGFADEAPEQNIQFTNLSCRQALTQIAEAFKMEFSLSGKEISIKWKVGNNTTLAFQYGRGNGLYTLTRKPIEDANLVTRVYGFGAERNIDMNYRDGIKRLIFEGAYLEKNVDIYGVKEGQYTNDDIYPHRTGAVTAVNDDNIFEITDADIDFNVNDYLLEGVTAQISFKTGALAGYTFDLNAFNNTTKTISFNQFTDSNDYLLPNDLNKPTIGDTYVLVNIKMPESYIEAAEAELLAATQDYLDQNSSPNVSYTLSIDEKFARQNNIEINVGDEINIFDNDLGIDQKIRVAEISYPIVNPFLISAVIAGTITYNVQERAIAQTVNNQRMLITTNKTQKENQRINSIIYRKLKDLIFDPDGYFQQGDLSALTIETGMLTVGLPSQNFSIDGVQIENNYGGDVNAFNISAGTLFHNVYSIDGLGNEWEVNGATIGSLDPDTAYYVYARCSRTALTGDWMIDAVQHKVDEETGYWKFNLGILFPVIGGTRQFRFTNGMSYMFGDNVVCGMVRSVDGTQYIDLNHSKFWFGEEGNSIDYAVTTPNTLTIDGALVSKMIFAEDAEIINLVIDTLVTTKPTDVTPNPQRVEIKKATNSIKFFIDGEENPVVVIDTIADSISGVVSAGIAVRDGTKSSEVSLNGIFSNASDHAFIPASSGIPNNASVVGLLQKRNTDIIPDGLSAAVVGLDQTDDGDGNSQSYGGYFNSVFAGGLYVSTRTIDADYSLKLTDTHIVSTDTLTIYLPQLTSYSAGKMYWIFITNGTPTLDGNGNSIATASGLVSSFAASGHVSNTCLMVWTGSFWTMNFF